MKDINRLLIFFAFVLLLISTATCGQTAAKTTATVAPTIQPGESTRSLTVGGLERNYLLHIPPGLNNLHPVPVVFALHGYTGGGFACAGGSRSRRITSRRF